MLKQFWKDPKGAAAVEFAIVLPILCLLLFGIIEFSALFYDKAVITNASREGARAGIVYGWPNRLTGAEIQTVVTNYLQNNLINFGGTSNATVTTSGAQGASGTPLSVTVNYRYDYLVLPGFVSAIGPAVNLSATTVMRLE